MLFRKIESQIEENLLSKNSKILCIDGARQVGKSYIIRHVCQKHFSNYIEINMANELSGEQQFKNVKTIYISFSLFS